VLEGCASLRDQDFLAELAELFVGLWPEPCGGAIRRQRRCDGGAGGAPSKGLRQHGCPENVYHLRRTECGALRKAGGRRRAGRSPRAEFGRVRLSRRRSRG